MEQLLVFFQPAIAQIIRYFLFAGGAFLIFYILFPNYFKLNKIQERWAKNKDFIREILHSMQTSFIIGGVAAGFVFTPLRAYTQIYLEASDFPLWWIPVSVVAALVVHDSYFYWMHRMMHHPVLYKRVHLVHHKSTNPSPFTSYSFHLLEGITEALIIPIIFFLLPMHPLALLGFGLSSFIINVYGHLGFEITPRWFRHSVFFQFVNTSVHHNLHHAKFKGNYGLYFRVWDRIMGTEHPDYVREFDRIQERRFGTLAPPKSQKVVLPILLILGLCFLSFVAKSQTIVGKWKDDYNGAIIQIYEENGSYHGQLIEALDAAENKQLQDLGKAVFVLKDFTKNEQDQDYCCGTIFHARHRLHLKGTLTLIDEQTLQVYGKYGFLSGTRVWQRI